MARVRPFDLYNLGLGGREILYEQQLKVNLTHNLASGIFANLPCLSVYLSVCISLCLYV